MYCSEASMYVHSHLMSLLRAGCDIFLIPIHSFLLLHLFSLIPSSDAIYSFYSDVRLEVTLFYILIVALL